MDRLEEHAASLQALLEQEEADTDAARQHLRVKEARCRRIKAAIRALTQEQVKKAKKSKSSAPSEKTLEQVSAIFKSSDLPNDGLTISDIVERTGLSKPSVLRGVNALRDVEIRLAGKKGPASVYKPLRTMEVAGNGASA